MDQQLHVTKKGKKNATPASRVSKFPNQVLSVSKDDARRDILWCRPWGKIIPLKSKEIKLHLVANKYEGNIKRWAAQVQKQK